MEEAPAPGPASRRRPTIADVARVAGVSPKTVSRVINRVSTVDAELAEKVRRASAELGFRPNPLAAALRTGRPQRTVAIVVKDIGNPVYSAIVAGAADVAARHGTHLIAAHTGESAADELAVIDDLCRRRVDGLLVVPSGGDHSSLAQEIQDGVPMVFLDRAPLGLSADTVLVDNLGGARRGLEALIRQGHRRVGVVLDSLDLQTMAERWEGVRAAHEDARLELDAGALLRTSVRDEQEAGEAAERLLDQPDAPTAFFAGNNRLALGVLEHLWGRGLDHPLLAFDDIPHARLLPRPLTCITWDPRELGALGADLLFRRMGGDLEDTQPVVLPTALVPYRGTTPQRST